MGDFNGGRRYGGDSSFHSNGYNNNNNNGYKPSWGYGEKNNYNKPFKDDEPYTREDESEEQLFAKAPTNIGINFDKYDNIPVEVYGVDAPSPIESFDAANLPPTLMKNIEKANYKKPTPVQKYAIPIISANRDLMACAQTGSGKTNAFLFPIINRLLKDGIDKKKGYVVAPSALILAPTRELATQIYDEARKFLYRSVVKTVCVYGGADAREQKRRLAYGCDILVATPGRLSDMLNRGHVAVTGVKYLVLDEADRMLDMGFEKQIRHIVEQSGMPDRSNRSTLLFSATFPREIQNLAKDFLKENYLFLAVGRVGAASENVEQHFEFCQPEQKKDLLLKHLAGRKGLVLIFTKTKNEADELERFLLERGFSASSIHGDRSQRQREYSLKNFKNGTVPILVATDVAARGLDIPSVEHVINYDLPENIDDYTHRIGRTGRAGNVGKATSFYMFKNRNIAPGLVKALQDAKQEVPPQLQKDAAYYNSKHSFGRGGYGGRGSYSNNNAGNYGRGNYASNNNGNYGRGGFGNRNGFNGGNNRGTFGQNGTYHQQNGGSF
jgi:ATP-dependent RNA helicase DDX3X